MVSSNVNRSLRDRVRAEVLERSNGMTYEERMVPNWKNPTIMETLFVCPNSVCGELARWQDKESIWRCTHCKNGRGFKDLAQWFGFIPR